METEYHWNSQEFFQKIYNRSANLSDLFCYGLGVDSPKSPFLFESITPTSSLLDTFEEQSKLTESEKRRNQIQEFVEDYANENIVKEGHKWCCLADKQVFTNEAAVIAHLKSTAHRGDIILRLQVLAEDAEQDHMGFFFSKMLFPDILAPQKKMPSNFVDFPGAWAPDLKEGWPKSKPTIKDSKSLDSKSLVKDKPDNVLQIMRKERYSVLTTPILTSEEMDELEKYIFGEISSPAGNSQSKSSDFGSVPIDPAKIFEKKTEVVTDNSSKEAETSSSKKKKKKGAKATTPETPKEVEKPPEKVIEKVPEKVAEKPVEKPKETPKEPEKQVATKKVVEKPMPKQTAKKVVAPPTAPTPAPVPTPTPAPVPKATEPPKPEPQKVVKVSTPQPPPAQPAPQPTPQPVVEEPPKLSPAYQYVLNLDRKIKKQIEDDLLAEILDDVVANLCDKLATRTYQETKKQVEKEKSEQEQQQQQQQVQLQQQQLLAQLAVVKPPQIPVIEEKEESSEEKMKKMIDKKLRRNARKQESELVLDEIIEELLETEIPHIVSETFADLLQELITGAPVNTPANTPNIFTSLSSPLSANIIMSQQLQTLQKGYSMQKTMAPNRGSQPTPNQNIQNPFNYPVQTPQMFSPATYQNYMAQNPAYASMLQQQMMANGMGFDPFQQNMARFYNMYNPGIPMDPLFAMNPTTTQPPSTAPMTSTAVPPLVPFADPKQTLFPTYVPSTATAPSSTAVTPTKPVVPSTTTPALPVPSVPTAPALTTTQASDTKPNLTVKPENYGLDSSLSVVCKNVPQQFCTVKDIFTFFQAEGPILLETFGAPDYLFRIIFLQGKDSGTCFVQLKTSVDVEKAVKMSGKKIAGVPITVERPGAVITSESGQKFTLRGITRNANFEAPPKFDLFGPTSFKNALNLNPGAPEYKPSTLSSTPPKGGSLFSSEVKVTTPQVPVAPVPVATPTPSVPLPVPVPTPATTTPSLLPSSLSNLYGSNFSNMSDSADEDWSDDSQFQHFTFDVPDAEPQTTSSSSFLNLNFGSLLGTTSSTVPSATNTSSAINSNVWGGWPTQPK